MFCLKKYPPEIEGYACQLQSASLPYPSLNLQLDAPNGSTYVSIWEADTQAGPDLPASKTSNAKENNLSVSTKHAAATQTSSLLARGKTNAIEETHSQSRFYVWCIEPAMWLHVLQLAD